MLSKSHIGFRPRRSLSTRSQKGSRVRSSSHDCAREPEGQSASSAIYKLLTETARTQMENGNDENDDDNDDQEDLSPNKALDVNPSATIFEQDEDINSNVSVTNISSSKLAQSVHTVVAQENDTERSSQKAAYITEILQNHLGCSDDEVLLAGTYSLISSCYISCDTGNRCYFLVYFDTNRL